jgi:hypothetical protein
MFGSLASYVRRHHVGALALFIALSGTAYAATLPRNSVGGAQLKRNAVTSAKVKNRSLTAVDLRRGQLPPPGVTATTDAFGPEVPHGPSGSGQEVQGSHAECPAGTIVTGGGFHGGVRDFVADAYMSGNGYFVITVNQGSIASSVQAQAICGDGPGAAAAARRLPARSAVAASERRRLAQLGHQLLQAR